MPSLAQIAEQVGGRLLGDGTLEIETVVDIRDPNADSTGIAVLFKANQAELAQSSPAGAFLCPEEIPGLDNQIVYPKARYGLLQLLRYLHPRSLPSYGWHESAIIHPDAQVSPESYIAANVTVGAGAAIASGVRIHENVSIGEDVRIGSGTELHPGVCIRERVVLGKDCLIQAGVVIGGDGFGYEKYQGKWEQIPHIGTVRIGDRVHIGANSTVDRGCLGDTEIADGVKIDNLCQIAHNVQIGEETAIASAVAIAGSVTIGKDVQIAGQVGIADQCEIANGVIILGQSGVTKSIKTPKIVVSGLPAQAVKDEWAYRATLNRLVKDKNKEKK